MLKRKGKNVKMYYKNAISKDKWRNVLDTQRGRFSCIHNPLICCLKRVKLQLTNYISINENFPLFRLQLFLCCSIINSKVILEGVAQRILGISIIIHLNVLIILFYKVICRGVTEAFWLFKFFLFGWKKCSISGSFG